MKSNKNFVYKIMKKKFQTKIEEMYMINLEIQYIERKNAASKVLLLF